MKPWSKKRHVSANRYERRDTSDVSKRIHDSKQPHIVECFKETKNSLIRVTVHPWGRRTSNTISGLRDPTVLIASDSCTVHTERVAWLVRSAVVSVTVWGRVRALSTRHFREQRENSTSRKAIRKQQKHKKWMDALSLGRRRWRRIRYDALSLRPFPFFFAFVVVCFVSTQLCLYLLCTLTKTGLQTPQLKVKKKVSKLEYTHPIGHLHRPALPEINY